MAQMAQMVGSVLAQDRTVTFCLANLNWIDPRYSRVQAGIGANLHRHPQRLMARGSMAGCAPHRDMLVAKDW